MSNAYTAVVFCSVRCWANTGAIIRMRPPSMASQPMSVTSTGQPSVQRLCTRTIERPVTKSKVPERYTRGAGVFAQIGRFIDSVIASAIKVGPSSPAICLEFVKVTSLLQHKLARLVEKGQKQGHSTLPKQLGPSLCARRENSEAVYLVCLVYPVCRVPRTRETRKPKEPDGPGPRHAQGNGFIRFSIP